MKTKFISFLNENNYNKSDFFVTEIGEILTLDIVSELQGIYMNDDDVNLFERSNKVKTEFNIRLRYNTEYPQDIHELLKGCDLIYNIYSLPAKSESVAPYWIDMGNGIYTIALEYGGRYTSTIKIYSSESRFIDYLRKLEEKVELEISANKYNL